MGRLCTAYKFPMSAPDDVTGLEALLDDGTVEAEDVVCVIGKTEGNGRVNDFSRPLAHRCLRDLLSRRTGLSADETDRRVAFVMSGGCEGIISPHATVFVSRQSSSSGAYGQKRLAFAMASTRELLPEEIGTIAQVELVAEAVKAALESAEIAGTEDVHYVQVKCPLLTTERINAAKARGFTTVTEDTLRSMGYSNGASGLGIAVGLGEVGAVDPADICTNPDLLRHEAARRPESN